MTASPSVIPEPLFRSPSSSSSSWNDDILDVAVNNGAGPAGEPAAPTVVLACCPVLVGIPKLMQSAPRTIDVKRDRKKLACQESTQVPLLITSVYAPILIAPILIPKSFVPKHKYCRTDIFSSRRSGTFSSAAVEYLQISADSKKKKN